MDVGVPGVSDTLRQFDWRVRADHPASLLDEFSSATARTSHCYVGDPGCHIVDSEIAITATMGAGRPYYPRHHHRVSCNHLPQFTVDFAVSPHLVGQTCPTAVRHSRALPPLVIVDRAV